MVIFFFLLFFSMQFSARAEDLNVVLEGYRRNVLAFRIEGLVSIREDALRVCMEEDLSFQESYFSILKKSLPFTHSRVASIDHVLKLMDAYRESEQLKQALPLQSFCRKKIEAADQKSFEEERKKFKFFYAGAAISRFRPFSLSPLEYLILELDPVCLEHPVADFGLKLPDGNPCMAGYGLLLQSLKDGSRKKGQTFEGAASVADHLLDEWYAQIRKLKPGETLDLRSALDSLVLETPIRKMALMTYFFASPGSRLGFVSPIGDGLWKSPLNRGEKSIQAYNQYMLWLNRKDDFGLLLHEAKKRNIHLGFGPTRVDSWNHHNWISAFLSCYYLQTGRKTLAHALPKVLGMVYEAKDFKSHVKAGVSYSASYQNFKVDTARYREGVNLGLQNCSP